MSLDILSRTIQWHNKLATVVPISYSVIAKDIEHFYSFTLYCDYQVKGLDANFICLTDAGGKL